MRAVDGVFGLNARGLPARAKEDGDDAAGDEVDLVV